jgi:hypothetical protein
MVKYSNGATWASYCGPAVWNGPSTVQAGDTIDASLIDERTQLKRTDLCEAAFATFFPHKSGLFLHREKCGGPFEKFSQRSRDPRRL